MDFEKRFLFASGLEITVSCEDHALRVTARKGEKIMRLRCRDTLTEEGFRLREDVPETDHEYTLCGLRYSAEEVGDAFLVHTCPTAEGGAPLPRLITHYRFEKAGEDAVRLTCWFGAREVVRASSLKLFSFRTDGDVRASTGFEPEFRFGKGSITHSVQAGAAALVADGMWAMMSCCGMAEVFVPPEGGESMLASSSGQVQSSDLRMLDEAHPVSCVLSFGEGEPRRPSFEAPRTPPVQPPRGVRHVLKAGRLRWALWERPNGVTLSGVSLKDFSPLDRVKVPLTQLRVCRVSDGQVFDITSEQEWDRVRVTESENSLRVYLENPCHIPLAVSVSGLAEEDCVRWQVRVMCFSDEYTVVSASYPQVAFGEGEKQVLFKPRNSGMTEENAFAREQRWWSPYPAGYRCGMPVLGIYDPERKRGSGLYAAVHMAAAERVELGACLFRSGEGRFLFDYPARDLTVPGNSFETAGSLVVRVLDGDWYDMAKIYGDWVHNHAEWCPPRGREDSPQWMRDVPLYVMDWMPNDNPDADPVPISIRPPTEPPRDNWIRKPIELADRLGMPIGYHLYNWHFNPFNNDFPYYFPVKEGLEEGVLQLREHGVHVMPYINGHIADTRDTRGENIRFDREMRRGAVKNPDGSLVLETYASHEPDGELCKLAAMCPTDAAWRNIMAETCLRLFREYHMSAVYLDQIGAHQMNLCCDPEHHHRPGNGTWWVRGYRLLMERLRREAPEGCGFTTESNAECYADQFDGFLTWQWVEANLVPFLPKVYAGRVQMLGRNTNGYKKKDPLYCRYHLGQALMFGQQMGWINSDVVDDPGKIDYLERLCRARWDRKEFFSAGEMLRPPVITSGQKRFLTDANMGRTPDLSMADTVLASAWKLGGRVMIMLTNCADDKALVTAAFDKAECGAMAGAEAVSYGDAALCTQEDGQIKAELGARSVLLVTAEGAE